MRTDVRACRFTPWCRKAQPLERICMLERPLHRLPAWRSRGQVRGQEFVIRPPPSSLVQQVSWALPQLLLHFFQAADVIPAASRLQAAEHELA